MRHRRTRTRADALRTCTRSVQFIDHDIDLNNTQTPADDGTNVLSFTFPEGDPALPPGSDVRITRGEVDKIDILRERDLGIATLNQTREALSMTPYTSFDQITSDPQLASELEQSYGSVDQVDLFVGGLAEDPASRGSSMVGPTFQAVIAQQF